MGTAPAERRRILGAVRLGAFGPIWVATALLFAVSPLVADGSLSNGALQAMLPFAGILAIAAIGQTLVIQQGGLDLSVPGTFSLGVVLVVVVPGGDPGKLGLALAVVLLVGLAAARGCPLWRSSPSPWCSWRPPSCAAQSGPALRPGGHQPSRGALGRAARRALSAR